VINLGNIAPPFPSFKPSSLSSTLVMAFISACAIANFSSVSLNFFNSVTFVASPYTKFNSVFILASLTAVSVFLSITADECDILLLERDFVL